MTAPKTLAEHVSDAVPALLARETVLSFDAIWQRLPQHVLAGAPTKKSVKAAIAACGWTLWRRGEGDVVYRAPPLQSDPVAVRGQSGDNVAAEQLQLLIGRIERLEEERRGISADIRDVYAEGKSTGFDVKTMRSIVRLRRMEPHDRQEADALLETYRAALGMA